MMLLSDIGYDNIVRHVAAAATKIAPCPKMTTPILLPQSLIVIQKLVRGLALQTLNQPTNRNLGRDRDQKVNMILRNVTLQNLDLLRPANLTDQLTQLIRNITGQHRLTIFRDPNQVKVDTENRVRTMLVSYHERRILKFSPKGEGTGVRGIFAVWTIT